MAWPLSQDYNEAIQEPALCFQDPDLRVCEAKCNAIGIPMPRSGNFADVYEMTAPSGKKWALKCFTRQVAGLRERYAAISAYLKQANLPFMVDFTYLEQGVKVKGQWYPALKMQWVEGLTLNEFVKEYADQPQYLELLGQIWLRLARRLREAKMAHADLQHGNVLLVPGAKATSLAIRLIDYDGMFVPALADKKSGEVGHPAYQHPQRLREGTYSIEVDRFPHLVIYTALRCLMVGGRYLWNKYDNGDNLLFKQSDLDAPANSALFAELRKLSGPEAGKLVEALRAAVSQPLEQTPLLDALVTDPAAVTTRRKPTSAVMPGPTEEAAGPESVFAAATAEGRSTPAASPRRPSPRPKANLWMYVSVALAVVSVGLVGALFAFRKKEPAETTPEVAVVRKDSEPPRKGGATPDPRVDPQPAPKVDPKTDPKTDPGPEPRIDPRPIPAPPPAGELRRFAPHPSTIGSIAFSADGRRLLSTCAEAIHWWDVAQEQPLKRTRFPDMVLLEAAFLPDGRRALCRTNQKQLVVFDLEISHGHLMQGHTADVHCFALSPDGRLAVSGSGEVGVQNGKPVPQDCSVRVWDVETRRELRRFTAHPAPIRHVAFTANGRYVLSQSDNLFCLWEAATGREVRRLDPLNITHLCACPDGRHAVLCCLPDEAIQLWDLTANRSVRTIAKPVPQISALAVAPDGRSILVGGGTIQKQDGKEIWTDGSIRLLDLASGKELRCFSGLRGKIRHVAVAPDGRFALSASGRTMRLWELPPVVAEAVPPPPPPPPPMPLARIPAPADEAQAKALKEIKEQYKLDYSRLKSTADRGALSGKLVQKAEETKDDAAGRFMLLSEARDLAAAAGDAPAAMSVIDRLAEQFTIDAAGMRLTALTTVSKLAGVNPAANKVLAENTAAAVEEAIAAENHETAARLLKLAAPAAKRAQLPALATRIQTLEKDVRDSQQEAALARAAADVLRERPDDADARLTRGKYLCLRKGDWEGGLPLLAAAKEPVLRALAQKDLAKPAAAAAQVEAGDGWWELAAQNQGLAQAQLQRRAAHWYGKAIADLSGATLDRIEARLKQVGESSSGRPAELAQEVRRFNGHTARVTSVAFSGDGKVAVSGSADRTMRVWDVQTGKEIQVFKNISSEVTAVALSADGKYAATINNTSVHLWEVESRAIRIAHGLSNSPLSSVVILPDNQRVIAVSREGTIWQVTARPGGGSGGSLLGRPRTALLALALSADGQTCLLGGADGYLQFLNPETRMEQQRLFGHKEDVLAVALSKDGKVALSASADKTARLWANPGGRMLHLLKGHAGKVTSAALSGDGRRAATGSEDKTVRVWDVRSGRELKRFTGHTDAVTSVALSPDGRWLLSAGADHTVRLWSVSR